MNGFFGFGIYFENFNLESWIIYGFVYLGRVERVI